MQNKILIVGGGLSGICLAHQLEERNVDFKIIDQGLNESSAIAAGMINPMVFRKMVKTWRGDDLIPYLKNFYPILEQKTGQRFFFSRMIRRVFSTQDEHDFWAERLKDPAYEGYIHKLENSDPTPDYVKKKYGDGWVKSPGYVDAKLFIKANHDYFHSKKKLNIENFDFQSLDPSNTTYKDEQFSHIVFAEGYRGKFNPFFNYLPLQQTKGEVLTVKSKAFRKDEILNRKCFVLPLESGDFKLGATFSWDTTDITPTEEARKQLLDQYEQLSNAQIQILDQEGGIRPTVTDRRPLIGKHPEKNNLFIFNGMGTKGYMIAPYFSEHFIDFLLDGAKLDNEVDIQRFYKKHYRRNK